MVETKESQKYNKEGKKTCEKIKYNKGKKPNKSDEKSKKS